VSLAVKIKGKKKKDLSKIHFYVCNKLGHFASHCPDRKKEKKDESCAVVSIVVDDFSKEFEKAFYLLSLDSSIGSSERFADSWIIDSGAYKHMIGMWGAFMSINGIGPGCNIMTDITQAVRRVGTV
jgi:hypothetical protein